MRKLTYPFVFLFTVCLTSMASAGSGSAVIPFHRGADNPGNYFYRTTIQISNITNAPIEVTITLFHWDGTLVQDGDDNMGTGLLQGYNFVNYDDDPPAASYKGIINPKESAGIGFKGIHGGLQPYGWGLVQWNQESDAAVGVVAHGYAETRFYSTNIGYQFAIPINGGEPF